MTKKLNLDITRFIAALLIVAIHTYPLNSINGTLDYMITRVLARIAVPLFLMITGYFVLPKAAKEKEVLVTYTKKIIKIYLICILLYLPFNFYMKDFKNITIFTFITNILCKGTFYHLWYFPALILGVWITYFMIKKLDTKKQIILIIVLYLIGLGGDSYYGLFSKINIIKQFYQGIFSIFTYTRNGIFYVPIFLYIGYFLHKSKSKLTIKKVSIATILSLIIMEIEGYILYHYQILHHTSMYIFLIPTSIFLFLTLLKINKTQNKKIRNISTLIYILHPLGIIIVRGLAKVSNLEQLFVQNSMIMYFSVCIITFIISYVITILIYKTKSYHNG